MNLMTSYYTLYAILSIYQGDHRMTEKYYALYIANSNNVLKLHYIFDKLEKALRYMTANSIVLEFEQ